MNYIEKFDEARQALNDIQPIETQYCFMYNSGIPEKIIADKSECPFRIPKDGD
jgi:hypothetical protein